ncbi:MAG: FKBP-type peptidyl-prolyl cis-trans isomerase [Muribaculaceae bacterium]|nr:FKBP-type peptidyl-prolyl cis-trans isomerase [Muribaculaceae bacterium]
MDKLSYALGLSMGHNFISSGIKSLNYGDFAEALAAVYEGTEKKMSFEDAKQVVNEYFMNLEKEVMEKNAEIGRKFLEENKKRAKVVVLPSGLQYEVLAAGEGEHPKATDQVTVHYTGTLVDGTVFDSSVQRGEPATFGVNQVIPGWVEALQLMVPGDKWRLYIPSNLAYGEQGAGQVIGPNATLVFEVELIKIVK